MNGAAGRTGTAHAGLASLAQRGPVLKQARQPAELAVGLGRPGQLCLDDLRILPPEPDLLEQEAAEIAELELPQPAQIADPATNLAPLAMRRCCADRRLVYQPAHGFIALQGGRV